MERLKNKVNKLVRKEKKAKSDNEITEVSKESCAKSLWNLVKNRACWSSPSAPTILKIGDIEFTTSPSKMASALNNFFVSKVEKIFDELKNYDLDPTQNLKSIVNSKD